MSQSYIQMINIETLPASLEKYMSTYEENLAFFHEAIECHYDGILKFLIRASGDGELAFDLTQSVMEDAWKQIDQMRNYENLRAGLYRIAYNKLRRHFKKTKYNDKIPQMVSLEEFEQEFDVDADVERIFEQAEANKILFRSFKKLRKDHATVLILHYVYEKTLREIADLYDYNYSTVVSWHDRALKYLRRQLMNPEG